MNDIQSLLTIMSRLRDPNSGCPWDIKQTYSTIVPYTLEEAYEVADAIQRADMSELRDELGDLLFQVVFYSQIASEEGHFDFNEVVEAICQKMIRRHPHVFSDAQYNTEEELHRAWEQGKAAERNANAKQSTSELDGIARALPALIRAEKLQKRASRVGFDWPDIRGVVDKLDEEVNELKQEIEAGDSDRIEDELGDLLFTAVNMVRMFGKSAEQTLSRANEKFERRFRAMEMNLAEQGKTDLSQLSMQELDLAWNKAKTES